MTRILVLLLSMILFAKGQDPLKAICTEENDLYYDHKCYTLVKEQKLWPDAQTHCMNLGNAKKKHLAIVTSSALANQIGQKWPNLVTRYYNGGPSTGGIMTGARMLLGTSTSGDHMTGNYLTKFYWYTSLTEYEEVMVKDTFMPKIPRKNDNSNTGNAFIAIEQLTAGSAYTRADRPNYWLAYFLCERDNFYRIFRKKATDKRMTAIFYDAIVPFQKCIDKCSTSSTCVSINFKKDSTGTGQHQCQLSALKSQDSSLEANVGFEVWDIED